MTRPPPPPASHPPAGAPVSSRSRRPGRRRSVSASSRCSSAARTPARARASHLPRRRAAASASPRGSARRRHSSSSSFFGSGSVARRPPRARRRRRPTRRDTHRFSAMGCEVVVGGATPAEALAVERLFEALEASLSRFRPDSDLERLNRSPAEVAIVSPLLATALDDALRAAAATAGSATPPIGAALDGGRLRPHVRGDRPRPALRAPVPAGRWREIKPLRPARAAPGRAPPRPQRRRQGTRRRRRARAARGDGFVSAGGDLATRGELVVALPGGDTVTLQAGALATSGVSTPLLGARGRQPRPPPDRPASGAPADAHAGSASPSAPRTCLAADVAAKTAFLLGDDGPGWLEQPRPAGPVRVGPTASCSPAAGPRARSRRVCTVASDDHRLVRRPRRRRLAYLLVSASVLAGILLAGKKRVPGFPRFAVEDVHRFLGLLAALFIAIHVGGIALDTYVPFSLRQLVVPFTAGYRPLATGLGIVALELLLAVSADEPAPRPPALPRLAARALRDARRVAARHGARRSSPAPTATRRGSSGSTPSPSRSSPAPPRCGSAAARRPRRVGAHARRRGRGARRVVGLAAVPQPASTVEDADASAVARSRRSTAASAARSRTTTAASSRSAAPRREAPRSGSTSSRATARAPRQRAPAALPGRRHLRGNADLARPDGLHGQRARSPAAARAPCQADWTVADGSRRPARSRPRAASASAGAA